MLFMEVRQGRWKGYVTAKGVNVQSSAVERAAGLSRVFGSELGREQQGGDVNGEHQQQMCPKVRKWTKLP